MKKIIITGGSRGLGQSLIEYFTKNNSTEIFVLQRNSLIENTQATNKSKIHPFHLHEIDKILAIHQFEAIIHCAAQYETKVINDGEPYSTNLAFSENILEKVIAKKIGHFINIDTLLPREVSTYADSKYLFREVLKQYSSQIQVSNIYLESFYGPGNFQHSFINNTINKLLSNTNTIPLTMGSQIRSFVYISDVLNAIGIILQTSYTAQNHGMFEYNLRGYDAVSIRDTIELICSISNSKIDRFQFGGIAPRALEPEIIAPSTANLNALGWQSTVNLSHGIAKTLNYLKRLNKN